MSAMFHSSSFTAPDCLHLRRRIFIICREKYALEEKSRGCLKGHNSGLRTWFKTTTQLTVGANISVFLSKRSISFFPQFCQLFRPDTRAIPVKKRVAVDCFNLTALSDEQPQETPHWPKLITDSLKATWFGGLNLMRILLKFSHSLNFLASWKSNCFHGISGCNSLSGLKKPLVKTRPV